MTTNGTANAAPIEIRGKDQTRLGKFKQERICLRQEKPI
jgi:hypothetical protein